jgi:hypothetical protein
MYSWGTRSTLWSHKAAADRVLRSQLLVESKSEIPSVHPERTVTKVPTLKNGLLSLAATGNLLIKPAVFLE